MALSHRHDHTGIITQSVYPALPCVPRPVRTQGQDTEPQGQELDHSLAYSWDTPYSTTIEVPLQEQRYTFRDSFPLQFTVGMSANILKPFLLYCRCGSV